MESFYVNLPSNVTTFHSDNSINRYRTLLPSPLLLDSSWRVGLAEIHYTNSWFNLREYNYINIVSFDDPTKQLIKTVILPPGRYSDINYLIQLITIKTTQRSSDPGCIITVMPQLGHNATSRRLTMKFGLTQQREYVIYSFTKELEDLLGVTRGWYSREHDMLQHQPYVSDSPNEVQPEVVVEDDVLESRRSYDTSAGIHSLMVYSDVVDYSLVGDCKAQLLRVVNIPSSSSFGDTVNIVYEKPYYLPLSNREISSIEIDIKDDSAVPVDFQFGRVEVTLHFVRYG